jgi:hypothetical protein
MNDEFVPALSRDRLGDRFGDFSGGIVAKLLPVVVAHNPVVEPNVLKLCHIGQFNW